MGLSTFSESAPAPGKEWTDTGNVHEGEGSKAAA